MKKKSKSKTVRKFGKCMDCQDKVKYVVGKDLFPRCVDCAVRKDARDTAIAEIRELNISIAKASMRINEILVTNRSVL